MSKKKPLPSMPELDNKLAELHELFLDICEGVAAFAQQAGEMPTDLAEQMQRRFVLITRDAGIAAANLYPAIRSARIREMTTTGATPSKAPTVAP